MTDFRFLAKIATSAEGLGIQEKTVVKSLERIFDKKNSVGIKEIYDEQFEFVYDENKASKQIVYLKEYIEEIIEENKTSQLDNKIIENLFNLHIQLSKLLNLVRK